MVRDSRNLARHELIGLRVRVAACSDPSLRGREGLVADETMKTLAIESQGGIVVVQKQGSTFEFTLDGRPVMIDGSTISHRPEDRTKKAG
jgi:ribonuclease P protein subunit POP4